MLVSQAAVRPTLRSRLHHPIFLDPSEPLRRSLNTLLLCCSQCATAWRHPDPGQIGPSFSPWCGEHLGEFPRSSYPPFIGMHLWQVVTMYRRRTSLGILDVLLA